MRIGCYSFLGKVFRIISMSRVENLKAKVADLYLAKTSNRDDWADWLFENHVFVVAKNAERIAERFGAKKDLAIAAAMLHDVADSVMSREDESHEEKSLSMARCLLRECNFSEEEISIIVDDAIRFHGCRGVNIPKTLEGKILASADAVAHLQTDFYDFAFKTLQEEETIENIRLWALPKIERDYRIKISFEEMRNEVSVEYERAKNLFTV